MVVGDVNSTLAAALAAAKLGVRVAHVNRAAVAGSTMPEEINRILTDSTDVLFTTERRQQNLAHEDPEQGPFVGT